MKARILCVDDEMNVLESFRRVLRLKYDLNTASSATDGLRLIEQNGPYAVIVSDMRMPETNGVEFLKKARELAPESIRIMLTGYADQDTAIRAINEGEIFRFLNKPIATDKFLGVLEDAIHQYNLVFAERELLEKTLTGSIDVMTEILSLTNPLAFSRATRIRNLAVKLAEAMGVENTWEIQIAAMLSHLAYVSIPSDTLLKQLKGETLAPEEAQM
ncbi:MAG: response regulator, partial [Opitutales bacterium]|nr:response regulator [Opitutales bacterium]